MMAPRYVPGYRLSRPTPVKALVIGRASSGKVQWGLHRGPIGAAVRDHAQAAEDRITVEALEWRVWIFRDLPELRPRDLQREPELFRRRRRVAKQRAPKAAALHGA